MVGVCVWLVSGDAHEFRRLLHVKHVKQQFDRWVWDNILRYTGGGSQSTQLNGRVKPRMIVKSIATHISRHIISQGQTPGRV